VIRTKVYQKTKKYLGESAAISDRNALGLKDQAEGIAINRRFSDGISEIVKLREGKLSVLVVIETIENG